VALAAGAGEHITVQCRVAPSLPAVHGDSLALRRILENLVRNGIESIDGKQGQVVLTAAPAGTGGVRITVSDTGRGMSEQELARAFDDFYTTKRDGTGLGLSVVRRLTSDLGARLQVQSQPGRGTTVILDLAPPPRPAPGA
jgi:two-component system sensor histidine kinase HydH